MDRTEPDVTAPLTAQAFARRPPGRWELSTRILFAAAAVTAIGSAILAALYVHLYYRIASGGSAAPGTITWSVPHADALLGCYVVLLVALVAAQSWWSWSTRRMLRDFGVTDFVVIRHWTKKVFLVLVALGFCCGLSQAYANPNPGRYDRAELLASAETSAVSMAMRVLALVFLLVGIWAVRAQIHQAVAVTRRWGDVALASGPPSAAQRSTPAAASVLPRATPAWAEGLAAEAVAAIPPADSEFWAWVRALAAERGADLAVLESTHESGRRAWSLASADRLPAGIEPGSLVTVFPDPPQPAHAVPKKPPASEPGAQWFALIEDAGLLHFQLLLPSRLPEWLAQARSAQRWGLYRTDDPEALTAVMPRPS